MKNQKLEAYAIALAPVDALKMVQRVISTHGQFIKNGVVVTPHGVDNVSFFEIADADAPIVDELVNLAERYNLYPLYVVHEDKTLPAERKVKWYSVDEAKIISKSISIPEFVKLIDKCKSKVKEIYRNDSVFLKVFLYQDDDGCPHLLMFNSERMPKYLAEKIGVSGWRKAVCKFMEEMHFEECVFKAVNYTNL